MASSPSDFNDLLTQSRLAKLRRLVAERVLDAPAFVSAYLSTLPGGVAGALAPEERAATLLLVRRLAELYARIDARADARVAWADITEYVGAAAYAAATTVETAAGPRAALVYRLAPEAEQPGAGPRAEDVPAEVRLARWIPELQLLFVAPATDAALHVYNHASRLVAILHAGLPPALSLAAARDGGGGGLAARAEAARRAAARPTLVGALETAPVETGSLAFLNTIATAAPGEDAAKAAEAAADASNGAAVFAHSSEDLVTPAELATIGQLTRDEAQQIARARAVLDKAGFVGAGERARAAATFARVRSVVESRRASLRFALGVDVDENRVALTFKQKEWVAREAEAVASRRGQAVADAAQVAADDAVARDAATRSAVLYDKVHRIVAARAHEAAARTDYAVERAAARAAHLAHPAGFTRTAAARLLNMTTTQLGSATETILPIMGTKGAGKVRAARGRDGCAGSARVLHPHPPPPPRSPSALRACAGALGQDAHDDCVGLARGDRGRVARGAAGADDCDADGRAARRRFFQRVRRL